MTKNISCKISMSLFVMLIFLAQQVYADPPPWAPAHGWRKQHESYYTGYAGRQWSDDYGISTGHCNREAIATVVGGAVGGAIGSAIGEGDNRAVAIIVGTILGSFIGHKIGQDLDNADRGCL